MKEMDQHAKASSNGDIGARHRKGVIANSDYTRLFERLRAKWKLDERVLLHKSSGDPDLSEYMARKGALGSTYMDEEGFIYVAIHDAGGASRSTWLEEMAHAIQFVNDGNVPLSCEGTEVAQREVEVNECLVDRGNRLKLNQCEVDCCNKALSYYRGML